MKDIKALQEWFEIIMGELKRARSQHPKWPDDIIHQAAILAEEAGEVVQASLQKTYEGANLSKVEYELVQTGAMVFRMLENLHYQRDCYSMEEANYRVLNPPK